MVRNIDILYYPEKIKEQGTVVILGNFDGVHIAHGEVIKRGVDYAKNNGLMSIVLMFENNTKSAKVITSNELKLELFADMGVDTVYIRKFTEDCMHQSPEEFIGYLIRELNMKAVSTGFDYRFGYKASGDTKTLGECCKKYGFKVLVTEAMSLEGHIISSTYIRELLDIGDVETAKKYISRSYCIWGSVEKGLQNGTKLGFPTANVKYEENANLPKNGVYAGYSEVDGIKYKCVINVGNNPTFDAQKITVESHILDFFGNIYGKKIKVYFEKRIRDDKKFENIEELKSAINQDIIVERETLESRI